jgi:DNA (cytosine-5)-methyltransferase 1
VPTIEDAEALQGFPRGWTSPARAKTKNGPRWKLTGNAVTVGVAEWLVDRVRHPGPVELQARPWSRNGKWPEAAYGCAGTVWRFEASCWPVRRKYRHLTDVVRVSEAEALSYRAAAGFLERTGRSSLRFNDDFLVDLRRHVKETAPMPSRARRRAALSTAAEP